MPADPRLALTLNTIAEAAEVLEHPWWIIGSAAAVLAGLEDDPADVDLLASEADARRLLRVWAVEPAQPSGSTLFQSSVFGTASVAPLPIEVMASLRVRGELLVPKTRRALRWGNGLLHMPEVAEQIAILERFGREKDLRRAERLRAML